MLRARLVQAVGDHARRCGAGEIVAVDRAVLPLASAVAERLELPLAMTDAEEAREEGSAGADPYFVARVLHVEEEGRRFSGKDQRKGQLPGRAVGGGALFRIRTSRHRTTSFCNVLYIIDL